MRRQDLNDLLAFLAIAREASFTKAAAKLGVSQSALSHIMRGLEERLGVRLLTRTTRKVSATAAGERLIRSLGPRFEEIEGELDALSELREKPAGTIRITAGEHAAVAALEPALAKLLPDYPDINVEIIVDYGFTDIVADRYDAGVRTRRTSRQRHDRCAHRAGHAHGRRWSPFVLCKTIKAKQTAGPHRTSVHQPSLTHLRRALRLGVRKARS